MIEKTNREKNKEHREQIVNFRKMHSCFTLQKIADKFNLSRERIRQILNSEKTPTRKITKKICPICGGKKAVQSKTCLKCRKDRCDRFGNVPIECAYCGKLLKRHKSYILDRIKRGTKNFFCSNSHTILFYRPHIKNKL